MKNISEFASRFTSPSHAQDLIKLVSMIENDNKINDVRWASYMLATTRHETAGTYKPIEEWGKGKDKKYGEIYYGRGYCQITWKANYDKFGSLIHVPLVTNPELALNPVYAYDIMSLGMVRGLFTGKKLSDYFNDSLTDYINARRIINGIDKAELISSYAVSFESALKDHLFKKKG